MHYPFTVWEYVEKAVELFSLFCDPSGGSIIIAGDLIDCPQVSFFPQEDHSERDILEREAVSLSKKLADIVKRFKKANILWGNHDWRTVKHLRKRLNVDAHFLVDGNLDILRWITKQVRGMTSHKALYYDAGPYGWAMQAGDNLICHPDHYSGRPLSTPRTVWNKMNKFNGDIRAVTVGHTHHAYEGKYLGEDLQLIETGCMCGMGNYAKEGTRGPWQPACCIITQFNGRTIFNETDVFSLTTPHKIGTV